MFSKIKWIFVLGDLKSVETLENPNRFTRNRKISLAELILSSISSPLPFFKKLTTTIELVHYFKQKAF